MKIRFLLDENLSPRIYTLLTKLSQQVGQLPEFMATQWVISETRRQADDPLEKFIGKFRFDKPDWADKHDCHIGETLNDDMKAE